MDRDCLPTNAIALALLGARAPPGERSCRSIPSPREQFHPQQELLVEALLRGVEFDATAQSSGRPLVKSFISSERTGGTGLSPPRWCEAFIHSAWLAQSATMRSFSSAAPWSWRGADGAQGRPVDCARVRHHAIEQALQRRVDGVVVAVDRARVASASRLDGVKPPAGTPFVQSSVDCSARPEGITKYER